MAPAADDATRLGPLYAARAETEVGAAVAALSGGAFASGGPLDPTVLVLKGVPGPADMAEGTALAGEDSVAFGKALAALGVPADAVLAVITAPGDDAAEDRGRLVATLVEAADPVWVVAVDAPAAKDAAAALQVPGLTPGRPLPRAGRVWLAVDGFEASLADDARKRRVWTQLRALRETRPPGWPAVAEAG